METTTTKKATKKVAKKARFSRAAVLRNIGVSYIGGTMTSQKVEKSVKNSGVLTYIIYLQPGRDAKTGVNVCPFSAVCYDYCLSESGRAKINTLAGLNRIHAARVKKTRALFNPEMRFDMIRAIYSEIKAAKAKAKRLGLKFAVRFNGTSDLNLKTIAAGPGQKNILEVFRGVQFYDYTKAPYNLATAKQYANLDVAFSYDGTNWATAEKWLNDGGNVAVIFAGSLPETWRGYKVINGDITDYRPADEKGVIVGLKFKTTAKHKEAPNSPGIVRV